MTKYRNNLPQLNGGLFLTDGGLETTLIFHEDIDLPSFAAFPLLRDESGYAKIFKYYSTYADIAEKNKAGFILESCTWRASTGWGEILGYNQSDLELANTRAIELLEDIRSVYESDHSKMVISGCLGPRGDGYAIGNIMTAKEAEEYHKTQIETLSKTNADFITALTMNYTEEAIGITHAARTEGIPVVISFTVETDGRLPSGESLKSAIQKVDEETDNTPEYYMINCAHPTHFNDVLSDNEPWLNRIHGIRANASSKSHAELDEAEELDDGNPDQLGKQFNELRSVLSNLNVLGGCCGTDHRHIDAISKSCISF